MFGSLHSSNELQTWRVFEFFFVSFPSSLIPIYTPLVLVGSESENILKPTPLIPDKEIWDSHWSDYNGLHKHTLTLRIINDLKTRRFIHNQNECTCGLIWINFNKRGRNFVRTSGATEQNRDQNQSSIGGKNNADLAPFSHIQYCTCYIDNTRVQNLSSRRKCVLTCIPFNHSALAVPRRSRLHLLASSPKRITPPPPNTTWG